jgi:hypothetical protein
MKVAESISRESGAAVLHWASAIPLGFGKLHDLQTNTFRIEIRWSKSEHDIEINICVPKTGLTCLKYSIYIINCALFIRSKTVVFYELACKQAGPTQFDCDVISSITQQQKC